MTLFSSGAHEKLTADPYPYRVEVRTELIDPAGRDDYLALREGERISSPEWTTFWDAEYERCIHDPRPEFDRPLTNPANPVLVSFREDMLNARMGQGEHQRDDYEWLTGPDWENYWQEHVTAEHVNHARKVLERLANLAINE